MIYEKKKKILFPSNTVQYSIAVAPFLQIKHCISQSSFNYITLPGDQRCQANAMQLCALTSPKSSTLFCSLCFALRSEARKEWWRLEHREGLCFLALFLVPSPHGSCCCSVWSFLLWSCCCISFFITASFLACLHSVLL